MNKKLIIALGGSAAIFALLVWILLDVLGGGVRDEGENGDRGGLLTEGSAADPEKAAEGALGSAKTAGDDREGADEPGIGAVSIAGARLHGRVTDGGGRGIPGADVLVRSSGSVFELDESERLHVAREVALGRTTPKRAMTVARTRTSADGRYALALRAIDPGRYRIHVMADDFAPDSESWKWTPEDSEVDFVLAPGERIVGVVHSPEGVVVGGALVQASSEDRGRGGPFGGGGRGGGGRQLASEAVCGPDGRFVLQVSAGSYRVEATAEGFAEGSLRRVSSGSDVVVTLEPARSVAGRVVDPDGESLANVEVALYTSSVFGGRGGRGRGRGGSGFTNIMRRIGSAPESTFSTGADGRFTFDEVEDGDYLLVASKKAFVTTELSGELEDEEDGDQVELRMTPGRAIVGRVTGSGDAPVSGALVIVGSDSDSSSRWGRFFGRGRDDDETDESGEKTFEELEAERRREEENRRDPISLYRATVATETDSDGRFTVDTLDRGVYAISVQADGFVPRRERKIDVREEPRVDVDIELDSGLTLRGKVVSSSDEKPVPEAAVSLRWREDRRAVKADEKGEFEIAGLSVGDLGQLRVDADGFTVEFLEDIQLEAQPQLQEITLQLDPNARILGRVTDSSGAPVRRARVRVQEARQESREGIDWQSMSRDEMRRMFEDRRSSERARWSRTSSEYTDGDGNFRIDDVTPSRGLVLEVEHANFKEFESDSFPLAPNEELKDMNVTLAMGGRIVAVVTSPDGSPVSGVRVFSRLSPLEDEEDEEDEERGSWFGGRRGGDGRRSSSRTTSTDGSAIFGGIDGGRYRVWTVHRGYQPFSVYVNVVEDRETPVDVALLQENEISGVVRDPQGQPIDRARIRATRRDANGDSQSSEDRSEDDGTFRVGTLGTGVYRVDIERRGYERETLEEVAVNTAIDVVLEPLGEIRGVVTTLETGAPVTEFTVSLRRVRQTAAGGSAEGIEEGSASSLEERGSRGRDGEGAREGRRGRGGDSGRGRFGDGGSGAGSERFRRGSRSGRPREYEDDEGRFTVDELTPGDYDVEVAAAGHTAVEVRVRVQGGTATTETLFELPEGLSVMGVVLDRSSRPVANAGVYLLAGRSEDSAGERPERKSVEERREDVRRAIEERRNASGGRRRGGGEENAKEAAALLGKLRNDNGRIEAEDDGSFRLREVPEGSYALVVYREGFLPHVEKLSVRLDKAVRSREVRLEPGETVVGRVTFAGRRDSGGGATLSFTDQYGLVRRVATDAKGEFRANGFLTGRYNVDVRFDGEAVGSLSYTVAEKTNRLEYEIPESQ